MDCHWTTCSLRYVFYFEQFSVLLAWRRSKLVMKSTKNISIFRISTTHTSLRGDVQAHRATATLIRFAHFQQWVPSPGSGEIWFSRSSNVRTKREPASTTVSVLSACDMSNSFFSQFECRHLDRLPDTVSVLHVASPKTESTKMKPKNMQKNGCVHYKNYTNTQQRICLQTAIIEPVKRAKLPNFTKSDAINESTAISFVDNFGADFLRQCQHHRVHRRMIGACSIRAAGTEYAAKI